MDVLSHFQPWDTFNNQYFNVQMVGEEVISGLRHRP